MISDSVFYMILGAVSVYVGMFIYHTFRLVKEILRKRRFLKNEMPRLVEYKDGCSGGHKYEEVTLAFGQIEPGSQLVCMECGFVSGTDYKLNEISIKMLREKKRVREEAEQAELDLQHILMQKISLLYNDWAIKHFKSEIPENELELREAFADACLQTMQLKQLLEQRTEAS